MNKDLFPPASLGFLRVSVIAPELRVADVPYNGRAIIEALEQAASRGCQVALFPELCITAYSCADLFYQSLLLKSGAFGAAVNCRSNRKIQHCSGGWFTAGSWR